MLISSAPSFTASCPNLLRAENAGKEADPPRVPPASSLANRSALLDNKLHPCTCSSTRIPFATITPNISAVALPFRGGADFLRRALARPPTPDLWTTIACSREIRARHRRHLHRCRSRSRPQRRNDLRRRAPQQVSARNHRLRRRLLRLRPRRLARHLPRQRLAPRRLPQRPGARLPSLQEQPRRHIHRRHPQGRPRRAPAGDRAAASATTTTTAGTISSSPTTARTCSITTTATAPSPTSPRRPASRARPPAGAPAAPSSTTTATATSISSSPTTSTST